LLPPRGQPLSRNYVAVGLSTRDHKGPFSKRLTVPLAPPPPAPAPPTICYDEKAITVTWDPVAASAAVQPPAADRERPSAADGLSPPRRAYHGSADCAERAT